MVLQYWKEEVKNMKVKLSYFEKMKKSKLRAFKRAVELDPTLQVKIRSMHNFINFALTDKYNRIIESVSLRKGNLIPWKWRVR